MTIELPPLPYAESALEPVISTETVSFHYGKHQAGYVQKTNELIKGTDLENTSLEDIILIAASDTVYTTLFNNAAQAWNHEFYWNSLTSDPEKQQIPAFLKKKIEEDFSSVEDLNNQLVEKGVAQFGSGWVWLVSENGHLKVVSTSNANTPLTTPDQKPLLCIDVWEHAYYLDEQNRRADYLKNVVSKRLNWTFAAENLEKA